MEALNKRESSRQGFQLFLKYFGLLMSLIYIGTGVIILFRGKEVYNIPEMYSLPLGSLLIAYGLFRGYKVFGKYFKN
jgi:hypothetical protein